MDEKEIGTLFYNLSNLLMLNENREAEAIQGYSDQLKVIEELLEKLGESEYSEFLVKLENATKEKISDELNHGESLYSEYVELTGIQPAAE